MQYNQHHKTLPDSSSSFAQKRKEKVDAFLAPVTGHCTLKVLQNMQEAVILQK